MTDDNDDDDGGDDDNDDDAKDNGYASQGSNTSEAASQGRCMMLMIKGANMQR